MLTSLRYLKNLTVYLKVTIDPSASYRRYLKHVNKCITKSMIIAIHASIPREGIG